MPIITLEGPKLRKDKKEEIVKSFTDAAISVMPYIPREAFVVILKENEAENVGVGGALLSELNKKK